MSSTSDAVASKIKASRKVLITVTAVVAFIAIISAFGIAYLSAWQSELSLSAKLAATAVITVVLSVVGVVLSFMLIDDDREDLKRDREDLKRDTSKAERELNQSRSDLMYEKNTNRRMVDQLGRDRDILERQVEALQIELTNAQISLPAGEQKTYAQIEKIGKIEPEDDDLDY